MTVDVVQVKFILAVIEGSLVVSNRKKKDIEADLEAQGFDRMSKSADNGSRKVVAKDPDNDDDEEEEAAAVGGSYDYLLSMAIQNLTEEKVRVLVPLLSNLSRVARASRQSLSAWEQGICWFQ